MTDPSPMSREAALECARAMTPTLAERAEQCEQERRLPAATESDFHHSGLFRILQPSRVGGAELDFYLLVEITAQLAKGCASSAWTFANLASHHWMLAMFPPGGQNEVWKTSPTVLTGSSVIFPAGRAVPAEGGFLVSGHWPFSSGVDCCSWNMVGAIHDDGAGNKRHLMLLLNRDQYEIIDTWYTAGLAGTGSKDIRADNAFVPAHRVVDVDDIKGGPSPGSAVNPGLLYRLPVYTLFPFVLSGVALGAAEGALEDFVEGLRTSTANYSGAQLAGLQNLHLKIGEASARIEAARLLMASCCAKVVAHAEAGSVPTMAEKMACRRDGAFSVDLCVEAVDLLFAASGGRGIYLRNPIQRVFRDIHAVRAHISFNMDVQGAAFGRVMLGMSADNPTL